MNAAPADRSRLLADAAGSCCLWFAARNKILARPVAVCCMTLLSGSLTLLGTVVVPFARIFDRFSGSAALALALVSGSRC